MDPYAEADLRRRQAEFGRVTRDIDVRNSWFAVPALAPEMVVGALETAGAITEALAGVSARRPPVVLTEREPPVKLRGDNFYTRLGKRKHAEFTTAAKQKPGWDAEKSIMTEKGTIRPDALTPVRDPLDPDKRFYLELKPDTPSGRRAAARAVRRYFEATGNKTRPVFYDPKS